jgi:hypothetical protein
MCAWTLRCASSVLPKEELTRVTPEKIDAHCVDAEE